MATRFRCFTLFDITTTGVSNRKPPIDASTDEIIEWQNKRNTQSNFDTIIQVISLRAQPEDISIPNKFEFKFSEVDYFGFLYDDNESHICWKFDFSVNYKSVFADKFSEFGALYTDCDVVPMVKNNSEFKKMPNFLDVSPEFRNIYFEVLSNE